MSVGERETGFAVAPALRAREVIPIGQATLYMIHARRWRCVVTTTPHATKGAVHVAQAHAVMGVIIAHLVTTPARK